MTILPDRADERVDACIARLAPGISRSAAQRLCTSVSVRNYIFLIHSFHNKERKLYHYENR